MEKIGRSIPVTRPYKLPLESNEWGGALFDSGSYIRKTSPSNIPTQNITLLTSVKILGFFNWNNFVQDSYWVTAGRIAWLLFADSSGQIIAGVSDATPIQYNAVVVGSIGKTYKDRITMLGHTYDGNAVKVYIDGVLKTTVVKAGLVFDVPVNVSSGNTGQGYQIQYDMMIFGQVLTEAQQQDLMYGRILPTQFDCRLWHDYRLGHARDLSGNGNHGTLNGNVRFV